jgi:UDP-N-acetylmuramoyl-L-alanyl-D-glutamate--2,6-diaminopimelate ligase
LFVKTLHDLIEGIDILETAGDAPSAPVQTLVFDSRKAEAGSLFVAMRGENTDGHQFIDIAVEKGATIIVCENLPTMLHGNVHYIKVGNSAEALGIMASNFYGRPSANMRLVGITGTNGKTTTATLLYQLFTDMGFKTGLVSTIENKIGRVVLPSQFTTPDSVALNALLAEMVAGGCAYAFMEVSSHAIEQRRIAGLTFAGGIFTNITHDHLDYHKTFSAYINAKKRFFDGLSKGAFALSNADDKRGRVMLQNTKAEKYFYTLRGMADFKAKILANGLTGLQLEMDGTELQARLIGEFNAYNLLCAYAAASLLGMDKMEVLVHLSNLRAAEGRFDYLFEKERNVIGIVDYAHTPDALEKVLVTIGQLKMPSAKVITVVGCGGNRDRAKRPIMAAAACAHSQHVILTSDNPRNERAEDIIEEMERGVPVLDKHKVLSITDRRQAIKAACALAQAGDIILVAGKGHEKYQDINGTKHPFDDKAVLSEFL